MVLVAVAVVAGGAASRGMVWCVVDGVSAGSGARLERVHGSGDCEPGGHDGMASVSGEQGDAQPLPASDPESEGCTDLDVDWLAWRASDGGERVGGEVGFESGGPGFFGSGGVGSIPVWAMGERGPRGAWPSVGERDDVGAGLAWRDGGLIRLNL